MSVNSKVNVGVGVAVILAGAVSLSRYSGHWGIYIGYIFLGMLLILNGISLNLGDRGQKIIRGLRYGFVGVGLFFLVFGLVSQIRS